MNVAYQLPADFGQYLSQSQAAAFAVIAANVRKELDETYPPAPEHAEAHRCMTSFLQEIEAQATASIARNDGNVVHWIGVAAKQMNPLLS